MPRFVVGNGNMSFYHGPFSLFLVFTICYETGAEISSEPSYILLNTAVSKQWGFPIQCPAGCKCQEFDCHSSNYSKQCGFSNGFCQMMLEEDPEYKVNWVRVYQNPDFDEQKVGCSTPERPTRRYIDGHADLYKEKTDVSLKCIE